MTVDVRDLPQKIEEAFAQAQAGVEVVIVDGGVPKARLVAVEEEQARQSIHPRVPNLHAGAYHVSDDFDDYLGDEFWGLKE